MPTNPPAPEPPRAVQIGNTIKRTTRNAAHDPVVMFVVGLVTGLVYARL